VSTEFGSSICIQIYDNPDKRFRREGDYMSTKKWDVVDVQAYEFPWSDSQDMRNHFRVFRMNSIPLEEVKNWIKPMMVCDIMVQKRLYYLAGESEEARWLRDVCAMGYMLELDQDEQKKLRALIRERPSPLVLNGYSNN
jgi:hypothetical protein